MVPLPGLLPSDSTLGAWLLVPHFSPDRQRVILPQSGVRVEPATLPPSSLLRRAGGCPVSRHEVWRDFFIAYLFLKVNILLDKVHICEHNIFMDDGEGREHGPTGPSTNATPPDIPPERQGGPEQSGCGSKRGPIAS